MNKLTEQTIRGYVNLKTVPNTIQIEINCQYSVKFKNEFALVLIEKKNRKSKLNRTSEIYVNLKIVPNTIWIEINPQYSVKF